MTRDEAKQLWPILKAYSEGATIQCRQRDSETWIDRDEWAFNSEEVNRYRVKPRELAELASTVGALNVTRSNLERELAEANARAGDWAGDVFRLKAQVAALRGAINSARDGFINLRPESGPMHRQMTKHIEALAAALAKVGK